MKRLSALILASTLSAWSHLVCATALEGSMTFLDPTGQLVGTNPITGDLDTRNGTMSVDPFSFFGFQMVTTSIELLGEGTHTRTDDLSGTSSTVTVNPGQLGAWIWLQWSVSEFPTFMVWDVSTNPNGARYTIVDSDGDGIPGHAFFSGPFPGFNMSYDFTVGEPPPGISVTIGIKGGTTQECSETGGSTVNLSATVSVVGGAEPGSVEWFVDGESVGNGETSTPFLTLGSHTVEALASSTTGETGADSINVLVRDTTAPELDVGFVNQAGEIITSTGSGNHINAHILPSDICDPSPVAEGAASPVFAVFDGDPIKIQSGKINTVELPTTAIELSATASDASGNSTSGMAVLTITD